MAVRLFIPIVLIAVGVALALSLRAWYAYDRYNWRYITCQQTSDLVIP